MGMVRASRVREIHHSAGQEEGPIRTFIVSLLGAAALAAGLVLIRHKGPEAPQLVREAHAGESQPGTISLERLRELGY